MSKIREQNKQLAAQCDSAETEIRQKANTIHRREEGEDEAEREDR